jgi:LVIVD repeat
MKRFDSTLFCLGKKKGMPTSSASTDATGRRACSTLTGAVRLAVFLLCTAVSAAAQCTGPGAPTTTQTHCLTGIAIPGNPIRSFDISWVDPGRGLYFLADRSNKGVDIISTKTKTFIGRAGDTSGPGTFVGILPGPITSPVDNNHSGPDGVVSRGKCLYAGDGDSTLKVFDISDPTHPVFVKSIPTGGTTRVDEMALTSDGDFLIAANNSEDPPFATLFAVDGDDGCDAISAVNKITVSPSFVPAGFGLSIEQPTWDESIQRFLVSVPTIKDNPAGCTFGPPNPCSGAMLVIDPTNLLNPIETVVPLVHCGPNGITIGPHGNVMEGCTPNNQPGDLETTIINDKSFKYVDVGGLTGSDEVWFDAGSDRYYTGSSAMPGGAVLGVVDGETNFLLEAIPQSGASHSVAADRRRHEVFVPQVAPSSVVGIGGDKTPVGAGICGGNNGCIAVYAVPGTEGKEEGDHHDSRD